MEGQAYIILAIVAIITLIVKFYYWGYQALAAYPDIHSVEVKFRQQGASGWSNDSFVTQVGGAAKVLEVVVTTKELWTRTSLFFAPFARIYHVFQRIELSNIIETKRQGRNRLDVHYRDETGENRSFSLVLRDVDRFVEALRQ